LLGNKTMRNNHYKKSVSKRSLKIKHRFMLGLKIIASIGIVAGMSLVFVLGHDFITQCDYFNAKTITVTGMQRLSSEEILKQARIHEGANILSANIVLTRKRLLAHPWIKDADIIRKLPDKITIHIKEHTPFAILDLGRKFIIDTHGDTFKEWSAMDPVNMPTVSGLDYSDLHVPGKAQTPPFKAVMSVLQLGRKEDIVLPNRLIKRIHVDREIGLTLYTFDKPKAILLGYGDYPDKYKSLESLLVHLSTKIEFSDFDSIDLNNIKRIVVNPVRIETPVKEHKEV